MLGDGDGGGTAGDTFSIGVSSVVVRLALLHVAQGVGWTPCAHLPPCGCLRLTDRASDVPRDEVLVVRDAPAPCQDALDAVLHGRARSVVLWTDPEALVVVLAAVPHRTIVIPDRVVELAAAAPRLSPRQRDTLRLVALGLSNRLIAAAQHQSLSTTKRDIADLLGIFDAPNRTALMSSAASLGFVTPNPWSHPDPTAAVIELVPPAGLEPALTAV